MKNDKMEFNKKKRKEQFGIAFVFFVILLSIIFASECVFAKVLSCSSDNPVSLWHLDSNAFD
jgi:hypothetical protein